MSRMPLVVQVVCNACDESVVLHGRGIEITVKWLEANLIVQDWVFADGKDYCPVCKAGAPAPKKKAKKKTKKKPKKKGKKRGEKTSN